MRSKRQAKPWHGYFEIDEPVRDFDKVLDEGWEDDVPEYITGDTLDHDESDTEEERVCCRNLLAFLFFVPFVLTCFLALSLLSWKNLKPKEATVKTISILQPEVEEPEKPVHRPEAPKPKAAPKRSVLDLLRMNPNQLYEATERYIEEQRCDPVLAYFLRAHQLEVQRNFLITNTFRNDWSLEMCLAHAEVVHHYITTARLDSRDAAALRMENPEIQRLVMAKGAVTNSVVFDRLLSAKVENENFGFAEKFDPSFQFGREDEMVSAFQNKHWLGGGFEIEDGAGPLRMNYIWRLDSTTITEYFVQVTSLIPQEMRKHDLYYMPAELQREVMHDCRSKSLDLINDCLEAKVNDFTRRTSSEKEREEIRLLVLMGIFPSDFMKKSGYFHRRIREHDGGRLFQDKDTDKHNATLAEDTKDLEDRLLKCLKSATSRGREKMSWLMSSFEHVAPSDKKKVIEYMLKHDLFATTEGNKVLKLAKNVITSTKQHAEDAKMQRIAKLVEEEEKQLLKKVGELVKKAKETAASSIDFELFRADMSAIFDFQLEYREVQRVIVDKWENHEAQVPGCFLEFLRGMRADRDVLKEKEKILFREWNIRPAHQQCISNLENTDEELWRLFVHFGDFGGFPRVDGTEAHMRSSSSIVWAEVWRMFSEMRADNRRRGLPFRRIDQHYMGQMAELWRRLLLSHEKFPYRDRVKHFEGVLRARDELDSNEDPRQIGPVLSGIVAEQSWGVRRTFLEFGSLKEDGLNGDVMSDRIHDAKVTIFATKHVLSLEEERRMRARPLGLQRLIMKEAANSVRTDGSFEAYLVSMQTKYLETHGPGCHWSGTRLR